MHMHVVAEFSYFRLPIEGAMKSGAGVLPAGIGVSPILCPELHFSHLNMIKDTFKIQTLLDATWVVSFEK